MSQKKLPTMRFSADEDEILSEFVQNNAILYDLKNPEFKNSTKKDLGKEGSECKKRWKTMRDHYKREKKEEKGTTGKAAKKKRAIYWQRLQFLDTVEDERGSLTNVLTPSDNKASTSTAQSGIGELDEHEEDNPPEPTHVGTSTQSTGGQRSESAIFGSRSKTRKESVTLQKYLLQRQKDREQFERLATDLMRQPEPPNENEIAMFFKTMAATVKQFRPDLVTQTKIAVFKIVTDMELLHQQSTVPHTMGFTNIQYNENTPSTLSPWTTPHSSYTEYHTESSSDIISQVLLGAEDDE